MLDILRVVVKLFRCRKENLLGVVGEVLIPAQKQFSCCSVVRTFNKNYRNKNLYVFNYVNWNSVY